MKNLYKFAAMAMYLALTGVSSASAQSYPSRPIQLVVPYAPGGGADVVSRVVAQAAATQLGQPIVVENRPGSGTIIGADVVARSKPDAYTLLVADSATLTTNQSLYKKLPYNAEKDFVPVTLVSHYPFLLVARPGFGPKTVKEVIEYARQNPQKINFASPGIGSPHHLSMELFMEETKTKMIHVPYKGAAPAIQDLVGGLVDLMFLDLAAGQQWIREGKIRAYAAATTARLPMFPDLPTMTEAGVQGFVASTWTGIVVPTGTPADAVNRLNEAFTKALNSAEVQKKLEGLGVNPMPSTQGRFAEHIQSETQRWARVIKAKNISLD